MAGHSNPSLRILIGAGSFPDAAAALRLIERLPQLVFLGLGGFLIEDPRTVLACQRPSQRIVLPSGTTRPAPSLSQARLLLQADARAFQHAGGKLAKAVSTGWTFSQGQGDLVTTALHAAQAWDILLMGNRPVHKKIGKVIVLTDNTNVGGIMDTVSKDLCRTYACGHVTFSVDAAPAVPSARAYRLKTLDDCIHTLGRMSGLAVLLDLAHGPVRTAHDLARVLDAARCPVMVFGASRATATLEHSTQIPEPDSAA